MSKQPTKPQTKAAAQSSTHMYLDWAKERLDEVDATLASLEKRVGELQGEARKRAGRALEDMRAQGESFRKAILKEGGASEAAWTKARAVLETDWKAFEGSVQEYVDAAGRQADQQRAAFQARAAAQLKAWREAAEKMNKAATGFAAERRAEIDSAVKRMKADAAAAQARLDKLGKAGSESWSAMRTALGETRAAFDRANQAVYEAFKRAA